MDFGTSFAASSFRKVLKGFEIGGLPYTDVQFHLKRLLAAGTPPDELQEVLRRCELITPLPDYAHAEVLQVIEEARQRAAALAAEQPPDIEIDIGDAESTLDLGAEMEMLRDALLAEQGKSRDTARALAERIASEQAARARGEEARRESEQFQAELRSARHGISDRDAVIAQMRVSLDESNARLSDLQHDRTEARASLESRAKSAAQMQADLDAARVALEKLQRDSTAERDKSSAALRGALADRDLMIAQMRVSLDESHARLSELQKDRAEARASLETRAKSGTQLQSDLDAARVALERSQQQAAQQLAEMAAMRDSLGALEKSSGDLRRTVAQRDAAMAQMQASLESRAASSVQIQSDLEAARATLEKSRREAAQQLAEMTASREMIAAQSKPLESELQSARRRVDALERELSASREAGAPLRSERDSLRGQLAALQSKLRDNESLVATLQQSVRSDARKVAELEAAAAPRAAAMSRETTADQQAVAAREAVVPRITSARQTVPIATVAIAKPRTRARFAAVGAAIVVLGVVAWAFLRQTTPSPVMAPAQAGGPAKPGTVLRDCADCPEFTVLPTGHFEQGSASSAPGAGSFEKPLHAVAISHPIAMSTNAVTVDDFRAFVTATGRNMQGCDIYDGDWRHRSDSSWENPGFAQSGSHPVTCASWSDAKAYAAWLSAKTGHHYRLPSASEWEYAARSGTAAVQPWTEASGACAGANVADQSAARRFPGWTVFACDDGYVFTAPAGTFKANSFGLNDMLGNVFQWTEDCWHPDYVGAPADGSARNDGDCSERELRGGSWFSTPAYVHASYRNHFAADYRTSSVGIRLVRDMDS